GTQSVFQGDVRTSRRLGDRVGFKVSARWFQGEEFAYDDPVEIAIRRVLETDPETWRSRLRDI
ncbi:MAG: hypothetical protein GWN07_25020, partial [Actinobacteria bacterium]|nr:hypothetical protein [Actinomycetota bacterium]NIS33837.1 hypothetical protein [Actinomycetota bacterium]NIU68661.1 hypothetical protein [Actinomycetota bacterium]NIW30507.1 hypothetical protein [Actinomycetota bacterium]NIX22914.1 hypothetical protein [Actinomycetota bacterium]